MWDDTHIYNLSQAKRYSQYKPSASDEETSFKDLQLMNPDVIGWIEIKDTGIDYPLVQGKSNIEYLYKNAEGDYSSGGSIFLDSSCSKNMSDFNSIIYGHHMARGVMFGDLDKYVEKDYFESHREGKIYFGGDEHRLEFFAYLDNVDGNDKEIYTYKVSGKEAKEEYIEGLILKSKYNANIDIGENDRIVLLSTCNRNMTNGRYILVGKITDDIDDTDATLVDNKTDKTLDLIDINRYLLTLIILLLCLLIYIIWRQVRKKH